MLKKNEEILYASTSANLYNFLGHTGFSDHYKIFQRILSFAKRAVDDLNGFAAEHAEVIDESDVLVKARSQPFIFVTFHTGSYYLLVSWLLKEGCQFYGLTDTSNIDKDYFKELMPLYKGKYNNNCFLKQLNVEKEGTIFELIRAMKQNYHTMAFLDGNNGIGGQIKDNENMLDMPFLKGIVKIRKGLAYISYLTKVPLVPVLAYESMGKNYLKIYEPIPIDTGNKEDFCVKAIGLIFKKFETHITKYFDQWANWPYVHTWSDLSVFLKNNSTTAEVDDRIYNKELTFNSLRFCPLKVQNKLYLFDRIQYSLTPVEESLRDLFSYKTNSDDRKNMVTKLFKTERERVVSLISRQILIEA